MNTFGLRTFFTTALSLGVSVFCAPVASAQVTNQGPAYTGNQIIERFAPALDASARDEGGPGLTRGLCLGTEAECPSNPARGRANTIVASPDPAPSFDLVVTFDYNSDVLTGVAKQNLDEFAKALRDERLRAASFLVEGHTDAKGSDSYNLGLSDRRARAVVAYLVGQDVDRSKLIAKGYGETRPRTANPLDAANRRVETRLHMTSNAELRQ